MERARGRRPRLGARAAELRSSRPARRAGDRALRELLALQSSDWAFLVRGTAGAYPRERAAGHAAALDRALAGDEGDGRVRSLAPHLAAARGLLGALRTFRPRDR